MPDKNRCECPEIGEASEDDLLLYREVEYKAMTHAPNECRGDYQLWQYVREGKILKLCSACCLTGDLLLCGN